MAAGRAVGAPLTGVRPGFAMGYRLTSGPRLSYHQPRPVTRTGSAYSQSIEPPNNTAQTSVPGFPSNRGDFVMRILFLFLVLP